MVDIAQMGCCLGSEAVHSGLPTYSGALGFPKVMQPAVIFFQKCFIDNSAVFYNAECFYVADCKVNTYIPLFVCVCFLYLVFT